MFTVKFKGGYFAVAKAPTTRKIDATRGIVYEITKGLKERALVYTPAKDIDEADTLLIGNEAFIPVNVKAQEARR